MKRTRSDSHRLAQEKTGFADVVPAEIARRDCLLLHVRQIDLSLARRPPLLDLVELDQDRGNLREDEACTELRGGG